MKKTLLCLLISCLLLLSGCKSIDPAKKAEIDKNIAMLAGENDPAVQAAVQAVADKLGDTGRILVRESGTEPLVRVMVEAPSEEQCRTLAQSVVDVICEKGHKA